MSYNVVFVGGPEVGKTSIITALVGRPFVCEHVCTIGPELIKYTYQKKNNEPENQESTEKIADFFLWDTAGQERYKSLAPIVFHDSHCAILVYDVNKKDSLNTADFWLSYFRQQTAGGLPVLLLANKCDSDMSDQRQITTEQGKEYAESKGLMFIEVSAKDRRGIDEILPTLMKKLALFSFPEDVASNAVPAELFTPYQPKKKCC